MIADLLIGKKGSGKSYYLIKHYIIPALQRGSQVYTNIDFGFEEYPHLSWCSVSRFAEYLKLDCRPLLFPVSDTEIQRLVTLPAKSPEAFRTPKKSMIIIDEIQDIFFTRDSHKVPQGVYTWFSWHRHGAIDLVATSQSPKLIDYQIVELFNRTIKIQNLGGFGFGRSTYQLRYYSRWNSFEHDTQKVERYDKNIFQLYRSCSAFGLAEEVRVPTFVKMFVFGIIVLVLLKLATKGNVLFSFFK